MPKTSVNATIELAAKMYPKGLSKTRIKQLDTLAEKLGQASLIANDNRVSLAAHIVAIAWHNGKATPAESLATAYAYVQAKKGKAFTGYTGTPKAIWFTPNGLPADMGGASSKNSPTGKPPAENPSNSYYPHNAGKRKGLPDNARLDAVGVNTTGKAGFTKCTPETKVALYIGAQLAADAVKGKATGKGKGKATGKGKGKGKGTTPANTRKATPARTRAEQREQRNAATTISTAERIARANPTPETAKTAE